MLEVKFESPASKEMMDYQLTFLYAELKLLGDHALDHERCPCERLDEVGDFCIAKHLTTVGEGYCIESIAMTADSGLKKVLSDIKNGATDLRREYLKAMSSGKEPDYDAIAQFARDARKQLEPYLWRYKQVKPALLQNTCSNNSVDLAMPAPFGWVGGKSRLSKKIVLLIPPHRTYVEPFAGAAWVFWAKTPSEVEVLNDLDPDLMRFYRGLGKIEKCNIAQLAKNWDTLKAKEGDLEPCELVTHVICSHSELRKSRRNLEHDKKMGIKICIGNAPSFHQRLPEYRERIKFVKLHNLDWEQVVRQYDAPDTFFYLDPPYHSSQNQRIYRYGEDQLTRLAKTLPKLKGKWLLSFDDDPEVRQAFAKFYTMPISTTYTVVGGKPRKARQLLIANYPISEGDMEMRQFDPLLAEIATKICSAGACFAKGDKKAKLPVCSPAQTKSLESCIQKVKVRIEETEYKGNPYAICRSSVGCRRGGSKKYEARVS